MLAPSTTCWVLTDGKAGDEVQCLGVAEALGLAPQIRRVAPRAPLVWLMPWGPVDPREAPARPGSPLAPPYPDILDRLRTPHRALSARGQARLGRPDLHGVPQGSAHRRRRGGLHLGSPARPAARPQRAGHAHLAPPRFGGAPRRGREQPPPRNCRGCPIRGSRCCSAATAGNHVFTPDDIERLSGMVKSLSCEARHHGHGLPPLAAAPDGQPARNRHAKRRILWDGAGKNPYLAMLAAADAIVVTADSVNMVGEACATGKPVLVFDLTTRHKRRRRGRSKPS